MNLRASLVSAAAALVTLAGGAAADAASIPGTREYDLTASVAMTSNFSFNTEAGRCQGVKASGWVGSGQELLEAETVKPVRVSVFVPPRGEEIFMNKKSGTGSKFKISGQTRRTGSMQSVTCDKAEDARIAACTGTHRFDTSIEIGVGINEKWSIQDGGDKMTDDVVAGCGDGTFPWDSAVARTGAVLLDSAQGSVSKLRRSKGTVTLTGGSAETCDVDYFGTGSCATTWTWKLRLTPVKKAKRKRR